MTLTYIAVQRVFFLGGGGGGGGMPTSHTLSSVEPELLKVM